MTFYKFLFYVLLFSHSFFCVVFSSFFVFISNFITSLLSVFFASFFHVSIPQLLNSPHPRVRGVPHDERWTPKKQNRYFGTISLQCDLLLILND